MPPGGALYRVVSQQSEIRILAYRAGALAQLGHNQVIALHPSRGWVVSAAPLARSAVQLEFPLASVQIDDPSMRREEGSDFPAEIDEEAKSGTRHNMLSAALLDEAHFPVVFVSGSTVARGPGSAAGAEDLNLTLRFSVAGRESMIAVPVHLERNGDRITATGRIGIKQSDLGLTPFSIMLGALQVQDQMDVKFRVVASR